MSMSTFESITPKSRAQFEVFGHELVKLMQGLASSPYYSDVVSSFISTTLASAPSTHKAFEKSLIAAIQVKDAEEKAAREKAEGKQKGLGKFRGFAKVVAEEGDEEEEAGVQQVYTDEELAAKAAAEEAALEREIERETSLKKLREQEELRRLENEKILAEKKRVVDQEEAKQKLAAGGFEIIAPAWDDKKKGKKGKR